jgi:hypothetical protein
MGILCIWLDYRHAGVGVGELSSKGPREMDCEATLLVLAPPKSNQACRGPRTC